VATKTNVSDIVTERKMKPSKIVRLGEESKKLNDVEKGQIANEMTVISFHELCNHFHIVKFPFLVECKNFMALEVHRKCWGPIFKTSGIAPD
jgi:hypothetical protein